MDANPSFSTCKSKWLHLQNFSTVKTYKHFFNFSHEQMIFTSFTNWSVLTFWWIKYFDFGDFDTSHWFDEKNWKSRIYLINFKEISNTKCMSGDEACLGLIGCWPSFCWRLGETQEMNEWVVHGSVFWPGLVATVPHSLVWGPLDNSYSLS